MSRHLGNIILVSVSAAFGFGCWSEPSSTDGGQKAAADQGHTEDSAVVVDAGQNIDAAVADLVTVTADAAVVEAWPHYGESCDSDAVCGPEGWCHDLYQESDDNRVCWKRCDTAGDCADFFYEHDTARCGAVVAGGPKICIALSGQLGTCGNRLNANCNHEDYSICIEDPRGYGVCVRVCNPHSPATCRANVPADHCGCMGADGCSTAIAFESGVTDDPDGVCAPVTSVGDLCGHNEQRRTPMLCTSGQECEYFSPVAVTGTCQ